MKMVTVAKLAASSLVFGAAFAVLPSVQEVSAATSATESEITQMAAYASKKAKKASAKGQLDKAVSFSEKAVSLRPTDVNYRLQLAEAYLAAGRFQSAEATFNDVLDLSPGNPRVSLKLALTKIGLGKPDTARAIVEDIKSALSPADYGLAMTLIGDTETAMSVLEAEIRANGGDMRGRQNLAFAYAMAGKWPQARVLAAQDLSPDLVDSRMTEWALLSRPKASYDQVASILGVKPVYDAGQPVALAMNRRAVPSPVQVAAVAADPVEVEVAVAEPVTAAAPYVAPVVEQVSSRQFVYEMGPRREIVQPIPASASPKAKPIVKTQPAVRVAGKAATQAPLVKAQANPVKTALAQPKATPAAAGPAPKASKSAVTGKFVIQMGAFGSQSSAKASWAKLSGKADALASKNAVTAAVSVKGKTLHRLAVSGFNTLAEAQAACEQVKAAGGQCFTRTGGADDKIRWAFLASPKPVQLASR
jgi:Flp pilus assembly protein TadD